MKWLDLGHNRIAAIEASFPDTFTNLSLVNNQLTTFPDVSESIKLLHLQYNKIQEISDGQLKKQSDVDGCGHYAKVNKRRGKL